MRLWASLEGLLKCAYPRASSHAQFLLRSRNINRVPFRRFRLRDDLGPTNPRLTNIARGTLAPTAVRDSHPTLLLLTPGSSLNRGPLEVTPELRSADHAFLLDYVRFRTYAHVSVIGLAPSTFRAQNLDW